MRDVTYTGTPYEVWKTLAGFSSARQLMRTYKSLMAAKEYADKHTGYGHIYIVTDRAGQTVHTGRAS